MALDPVTAIFELITQGQQRGLQEDQLKADLQKAFYQYASDWAKTQVVDTSTRLGSIVGFIRQLTQSVLELSFTAALFSPLWGVTLTENAQRLPWQGWLIILFPLYGMATLQIMPWFKKNGNGGSNGLTPPPPTPAFNAPRNGH